MINTNFSDDWFEILTFATGLTTDLLFQLSLIGRLEKNFLVIYFGTTHNEKQAVVCLPLYAQADSGSSEPWQILTGMYEGEENLFVTVP